MCFIFVTFNDSTGLIKNYKTKKKSSSFNFANYLHLTHPWNTIYFNPSRAMWMCFIFHLLLRSNNKQKILLIIILLLLHSLLFFFSIEKVLSKKRNAVWACCIKNVLCQWFGYASWFSVLYYVVCVIHSVGTDVLVPIFFLFVSFFRSLFLFLFILKNALFWYACKYDGFNFCKVIQNNIFFFASFCTQYIKVDRVSWMRNWCETNKHQPSWLEDMYEHKTTTTTKIHSKEK